MIRPNLPACSDHALAVIGEILHARMDNANRMIELDRYIRDACATPFTAQQLELYVRDYIDGSRQLAELHSEYERRIGELLVIPA